MIGIRDSLLKCNMEWNNRPVPVMVIHLSSPNSNSWYASPACIQGPNPIIIVLETKSCLWVFCNFDVSFSLYIYQWLCITFMKLIMFSKLTSKSLVLRALKGTIFFWGPLSLGELEDLTYFAFIKWLKTEIFQPHRYMKYRHTHLETDLVVISFTSIHANVNVKSTEKE